MAEYIYEQSASKTTTVRYLKKFKHYIIQTLELFPKAGRPAGELEPNSRKLVYQGYSIIYKISEEQVEILIIYRENMPKIWE
jgi:plasmid stabilization system protein ParE